MRVNGTSARYAELEVFFGIKNLSPTLFNTTHIITVSSNVIAIPFELPICTHSIQIHLNDSPNMTRESLLCVERSQS